MSNVTGPVPPPVILSANTDFDRWVAHYAQVVCAAHALVPVEDHHLIDPCAQCRQEARVIAWARWEAQEQTSRRRGAEERDSTVRVEKGPS